MSGAPIHFNVQNNHPLIPREQNYTVNRKLVTIHSEDRDICKWPKSNHFEIQLPEPIQNVHCIRLASCAFPSHFYNISNDFQNNSFCYDASGGLEKQVTIPDGNYSEKQLAIVLNNLLSADNISVVYDPVLQRFIFDSDNSFNLKFNKKIEYSGACVKQFWCDPLKWGLGYVLGFEKKEYSSTTTIPDYLQHDYSEEECMNDYTNLTNIILSPQFPKLKSEHVMYMEVDKFDSYDELIPNPSKTNHVFQNTYGGKVNSAFAKIPVSSTSSCDIETTFSNKSDNLINISFYDPPIEKIQKLKFSFRWHNGLPVDFQNSDFTFTMEFNSLRNDLEKKYTIGAPNLCTL